WVLRHRHHKGTKCPGVFGGARPSQIDLGPPARRLPRRGAAVEDCIDPTVRERSTRCVTCSQPGPSPKPAVDATAGGAEVSTVVGPTSTPSRFEHALNVWCGFATTREAAREPL